MAYTRKFNPRLHMSQSEYISNILTINFTENTSKLKIAALKMSIFDLLFVKFTFENRRYTLVRFRLRNT